MTANVGSMDQKIRIILGVLIAAAGYYFSSWWGLIGLLVIGTAFIKFCPAYLPFGFKTNKESAE